MRKMDNMGHTDSGRQKVNGGFERKGEGRGEVVEVEEQKGGDGVEETWRWVEGRA